MTVARTIYSPVAPRVVLAVLAAASYVIAWSTLDLDYLQAPGLFALSYALAATLCLWCAFAFTDVRAVALAGGAIITVNVVNGLVLAVGFVGQVDDFDRFTAGQIVVGVVKWWLLAFLIAVLFFRRVTPLASEQRLRDD